MTARNYERDAETSRKSFFENEKISNKNKDAVRDYLLVWERKVSPARKRLFFRNIVPFLERTEDIKIDMHDPKKINEIFNELHKKLSAGYYSTVLNVSASLTRSLNNGEKPLGFKEIKPLAKKDQMRDLDRSDMWEWNDALIFCNKTNSIQMKAIIQTQLDAGLRPSEFVDLNFGDVEQAKGVLILKIRKGKTGKRDVIVKRCVPMLSKWIQMHPFKEKNSPLWLTENNQKNERYDYDALRFRVAYISKKADIKKPADFYNLRHSSCFLDKIENYPLDFSAEKHGHSVEYFTKVYGRLDTNDRVERLNKHYGEGEKNKELQINISCEICGFINESGSEVCFKCSNPLTIQKALEMKSTKDKEIEKLKEQVNAIYSFIEQSGIAKDILNKAKERKLERMNENAKTKH